MSSLSAAAPAIVQIGSGSSAPFPMFDRVWETFGTKSIRTVFLSIGNSTSSAADLDIVESIGCPLHVVPLSATGRAQWEEVTACLQAKKREGAVATHPFSEGAESKWILPKNIRIQAALPYWSAGQIQLEETTVFVQPVQACMEAICKEMKITEEGGRLDFLKVDTRTEWPGLERSLLSAILDAGYRPGVVLVNWSVPPDTDLRSTLAAGHLQNAGYRLYAKQDETKFLYFYTDNDLYQLCSWEDTRVPNPLLSELIRQLHPSPPAHSPTEVPAPEQEATSHASA